MPDFIDVDAMLLRRYALRAPAMRAVVYAYGAMLPRQRYARAQRRDVVITHEYDGRRDTGCFFHFARHFRRYAGAMPYCLRRQRSCHAAACLIHAPSLLRCRHAATMLTCLMDVDAATPARAEFA